MTHMIKNIAVDLTPMRPGGANGGIKPLIMEALRIVALQLSGQARFTYYTNSATHREISLLAKYGDTLVCIIPESEFPLTPTGPQIYRNLKDSADNPILLLKHDVDVLYCPFGATTLACPGIPTISCLADLLHKDFPPSLTASEIEHRETYLRQTMQISDSLNCISQYVIGRVKECYPEYTGEYFYTYNTIQDRFAPVKSTPIELPTAPYFFYPANFWIHKNHEGLLIAYQIYLSQTSDKARDLVLTGHMDDRSEEIKKIAHALGIEKQVKFLGHVCESQLKFIWEHSFALVFPSLHEGFGIPLLEAMHFGKPAICSDSCCLPEVGGNAFIYVNARRPEEIAEAMLRLHQQPRLAQDIAAKAKSRLSEFSLTQEIQKLSNRLLAAKPTRLWNKYIKPGGYFSGQALISIPATTGRHKLCVELSSPEKTTAITLYAGKLPLGTHRLMDTQPTCINFWIQNPSGCLRIEAHASSNLNGKHIEARIHAAYLTSESGSIKTLTCF